LRNIEKCNSILGISNFDGIWYFDFSLKSLLSSQKNILDRKLTLKAFPKPKNVKTTKI